jgi:hypothetical protein
MLTWHRDTWKLTWQRMGMLTGKVWKMWTIHHLTSVPFTGKLNGATWPRHGLPCGTPSFVGRCKRDCWTLVDSTSRPLARGALWAGQLPTHHHVTCYTNATLKYLKCDYGMGGGGRGWGLAPPRDHIATIQPTCQWFGAPLHG